ncbi:threonine aldolase family protein [Palleronia sp. KMU-117]|uniref:threonine aldolase family protein n=1 Tax=Palleronia sp. KMU-117 TaxID=3434108 RepID=UPI003D75D26E
MHFASDNTGPAHPKVIEALHRANEGYALPYGADPLTERVQERIREVFEAPEAAVYLVATGTAANSILLATLCQPWQTIFCAPHAHIHEDECGCPEFFAGGAKLTLVHGREDKMEPDALRAAIEGEETRGVHGVQRGPVSITQATERGTLHSLEEIRALTDVAKAYGLPVHMDGARFANAMVSLGCSAAEMTWKAGVDAVSFGGTKNGLLGVEAAVIFDPAKAWEFELRRKRSAHLFSKHRYLSAQMEAYLEDGLWLEMAERANAACRRLADGLKGVPGARLRFEPEANMIFVELPRAAHRRLHDAGAEYYLWAGSLDGDDPDEPLSARLVCDWSARTEDIDRFVRIAAG